jgi:1-acyl-sn-glycerol-3-phosphate acyltransferase
LAPAFLSRDKKIADRGAKIWSIGVFWMLKKICRIDYKIIGKENISKTPCIYACKHQSMWETVIMHLIIDRPVYAYKKELELIPFYGWFIKFMSGIKVDRKGGAKSLKSVISQAKKYLGKGQSIIIFPQGTRVPVDGSIEKYPYQAGITALYNSCDVKIVPVALNSGFFWPKGKIMKKNGTITIEFLPAIECGLRKEEFNRKLISLIEEKSKNLPKK